MTTTDDTGTAAAEGRTSRVQRTLVEMSDGQKFVVRITNPDRLRWDLTAPRKGWGKAQDVPFFAQTFVAWAAAKRQGDTDLPWEKFQEAAVELTDLTTPEDQEDVDVIRPTERAATDAL